MVILVVLQTNTYKVVDINLDVFLILKYCSTRNKPG